MGEDNGSEIVELVPLSAGILTCGPEVSPSLIVDTFV